MVSPLARTTSKMSSPMAPVETGVHLPPSSCSCLVLVQQRGAEEAAQLQVGFVGVPLFGAERAGHVLLDFGDRRAASHIERGIAHIGALEGAAALAINDFALHVHDVIELQRVLAALEVV